MENKTRTTNFVKIIVSFANVQKINEWVVRLTTKLILLESLIPVICSKQLFVNKVRQNYQLWAIQTEVGIDLTRKGS